MSRRDPDLVRSYVRAGGRTRASRDLDLVTLVRAVAEPRPDHRPDERRLLLLSSKRGALSIAELSAYLDLPASVCKIIVADLLDSGHLQCRNTIEVKPELALIKEVLHGLRAIAG
ncbi:DUF742 domain-containing protein [Nocardia camponoti]|uniref:DUF742 domain-containing protein n=1 Tax=Nocardia camponoti TaxID=1616106 RepID=A0A917V353_9NOCA|nr:DUF742 domain-containing protein [Nocardia camponoti]GGK33167.1 hypothetical protein GCM10011591_00990 [Nocardia camponoti]